jgi:hypothetical protein
VSGVVAGEAEKEEVERCVAAFAKCFLEQMGEHKESGKTRDEDEQEENLVTIRHQLLAGYEHETRWQRPRANGTERVERLFGVPCTLVYQQAPGAPEPSPQSLLIWKCNKCFSILWERVTGLK